MRNTSIFKLYKLTMDDYSVIREYFYTDDDTFNKFQQFINSFSSKKSKTIKYNILYVCDAKYLMQKMSRVRFWVIKNLSQDDDIKLYMTGPGFNNFNITKSLQKNIMQMKINFDLVIWYKPLNPNYNFKKGTKLPFKTCLRYNEMWDETWTKQEINESQTDIIICHHQNDHIKYKELYKKDKTKQFFYIPHCANPLLFKPLIPFNEKPIDICISGVLKQEHYPLKYRLVNIIKKNTGTKLRKYKIYLHQHPGYDNNLSFTNLNQFRYNQILNQSKLCIACTSKHNYRLGKYVEIPMSGSVILGDLPYEDVKFKDFIVEVNNNMSDDEILNIICKYLDNKKRLNEKREIGLEWSKNHTVDKYVNTFMNTVISNRSTIYIISDEIREGHPEFKNEKWICDILKEEFKQKFPDHFTTDINQADIIWYLAPWNYKFLPPRMNLNEWIAILTNKKVVFTQHHIDKDKINELKAQFEFMNKYGNYFHAICKNTQKDMETFFPKEKIIYKQLWVNGENYYPIEDKSHLRKKYNISKNEYIVGSFQKDTEGKSNLPKLSKGPDLFINIIKDMYSKNKNLAVILTGLRREYIINELTKAGIKYYYFNMVSKQVINELYNCLDLYLVTSRCEGGPRSVFEAGLTKTPIISTNVGIVSELMSRKAIFDNSIWISYKNAVPNIELLYTNVKKLASNEYINEFKHFLINVGITNS
jgi:hypothetical protein